MNIILVISDTFRRDHLGCYGNRWIKTPNIDRLAAESVVFDRAYAASFPTVPNRKDVVTGKYTFTYTDWGPLASDEVVLADSLRGAGYVTMLICDTPHILKDGYNFDRGYDGWIWVRGQENDRYSTDPIEVKFPCDPGKLRSPETTMVQYLRNTSEMKSESDHFVARTMAESAKWLEKNWKHDKFFLCVDTFDPHEPWDPPKKYVDLYDPGYSGEEVTYPAYGPCDYLTPAELKHARALYAGEATMVDHWVGCLLKKVRKLGLWDKTAVIFTTDHGFYHGEHGLIGKSIITETAHGLAPLYSEVASIPLMIKMPGVKPTRCDSLVQPPDFAPTILEIGEAKTPSAMQGKSLIPLVHGETPSWRDIAVSSPSIIHGPVAGQRISVINKDWYFIYCGQVNDALRDLPPQQETKIVDGFRRLQKIMGEAPRNELYNLPRDPNQQFNVYSKNKDVAETLHRKLVSFLKSVGTKAEILKYWERLD